MEISPLYKAIFKAISPKVDVQEDFENAAAGNILHMAKLVEIAEKHGIEESHVMDTVNSRQFAIGHF